MYGKYFQEGWLAYTTGTVCRYAAGTEERIQWEAGFEAAADFWPEQSR